MKKSSLVPLTLLLLATSDVRAQDLPKVTLPPPVSGRSLSAPDTITPADTLARVGLIHDNLDLIRQFMGRPKPPPPLLRVENAAPREVFFQSFNLLRRAHQLSLEQLRVQPEMARGLSTQAKPAKVFAQLDQALLVVLNVKRALGIDEAVAEKARPNSTTSSEVFNAIVEAGQLLNVCLDKKTAATDIFGGITMGIQVASQMHKEFTKAFLPTEPAFEPNKTPTDVYRVLHRSLNLVGQLAQTRDIEMLKFELSEDSIRITTPDDVSELLALMVAQLWYLYEVTYGKPPLIPFYRAERKYPAHTFQRGRHLNLILEQLIASKVKKGKK